MDILTSTQATHRALGRSPRSSSRESGTESACALFGWLNVRRAMSFLLIGFIVMAISRGAVQAQGANEYQIKAAFLFNFAKFVEWPPESYNQTGGALVFGVVGDDGFSSALEQAVQGKTLNGRGLVVRRLKNGQGANGCQIVFIAASERKRAAQIIDSLRGASVLTVCDFEPGGGSNGIINFVMEQSKLRFVINAEAAEQVRLHISAKLLALAKSVKN